MKGSTDLVVMVVCALFYSAFSCFFTDERLGISQRFARTHGTVWSFHGPGSINQGKQREYARTLARRHVLVLIFDFCTLKKSIVVCLVLLYIIFLWFLHIAARDLGMYLLKNACKQPGQRASKQSRASGDGLAP